jgi:hypothetical protein
MAAARWMDKKKIVLLHQILGGVGEACVVDGGLIITLK